MHGNSANSPRTAYLYQLFQGGQYLRTGISENPGSRYTQLFMQDKELNLLTQGTRREKAEPREVYVQRDPGPLNNGRFAVRHPTIPPPRN